jgi:hypothetical protein
VNDVATTTLESRIDDLYKVPLGEFTVTRAALAKTLNGAEAQRVKRLQKPTIVPWATNQVYWKARDAYDRVTTSGEQLRRAQIAALNGRSADVRRTADAHRKAIADAVAVASRLAADAGARASADALARTFEAVSLAPQLPERHGRLTRPLQPAGFEALTGVTVRSATRAHPVRPVPLAQSASPHRDHEDLGAVRSRERDARAAAAAERRRQHELAAARRRTNAAIKNAEAHVEKARTVEARARRAWERAKNDLDVATHNLDEARRSH